ncbi:hypothetical protein AU184_08710 [Mycolicibacterium novocastrense]|uniref:nuclear transport factor 2 family protein n=1 Tax=Mycolicibacterium novocastrense TaxID=59813 RepID=UPI0007475840|nr:nuclear transport factor 2 family protein [Mycolicibacterium novocastrense]KUH69800.1 hypothetical protein AU184_08710 [Mycolicibacterium novocastrense]KUH71349.1 hypothetical protein AU183_06080 [Mycolicibacterium novocastrense]KUH74413.1 hypothetical protein AU072_17495 [Mycolicibacterium novocastrense]
MTDLAQLSDIENIRTLATGWIHRDTGSWSDLLNLFHPDGTIKLAWFEGLAKDFVEASRRMGETVLRSKHVIANPVITFAGERALVETNAMIIVENSELDLGACAYNRFLDRVEKRDGTWRIAHRDSVYDFATFSYPSGPVPVDKAVVHSFPREYAALAYVLVNSGYPVKGLYATRGSELEHSMREAGSRWLAG